MRYFLVIVFLTLGFLLLAVENFQPLNNLYVKKNESNVSTSRIKNDSIIDYQGFVDLEKKWVDSVYQALDIDERIGQLFMIAAYSNKDSNHVHSIDKLIVDNKIG